MITYRDGVPTFPGYFQDEPYYDIANMEMLRGPQGTFVGQNATGGAVFITETNPSFEGVHGYRCRPIRQLQRRPAPGRGQPADQRHTGQRGWPSTPSAATASTPTWADTTAITAS